MYVYPYIIHTFHFHHQSNSLSSPVSMLRLLRFSAIAIAILVILGGPTETESHTKSDCGVAETAFGMCVPYVMGEEPNVVPKCCAAVNSVMELSVTPAMRRDMCECLRRLMVRVGRIDSQRALGLPGQCGLVTNVIPTSLQFDCYRLE